MNKQTDIPLKAQIQKTTLSDGRMCPDVDPSTINDIPKGTQIFIDTDTVENAEYRAGLDYGTLVVPFKFQATGKNSLTGSAAVGGYLGYRLPASLLGMRLRPIVFAGVSSVPTSQTDAAGRKTSQTVAGLSYGVGIVGRIKDSFNLGLVVGFDHVDSIQPYPYQDKPWISLQIGYSFTK